MTNMYLNTIQVLFACCLFGWVTAVDQPSCSNCQLTDISTATQRQPNIVFIIADDLGHADLGYSEGSHQTPTPNINRLAWDGIILNRHYSHPICTPTRSALLTGRYVFHLGLQMNRAIEPGQPWGVPLNYKLLPQFLKYLNYYTIFLGKWHIGAHTRAYYPESRGFDYALGYPEGEIAAFNYTTGWLTPTSGRSGRTLYENGFQVPENCTNNIYLPHLLVEKFEQLIHAADLSKPFYVQFATPLPKTGNEGDGVTRVTRQFTMPEYSSRPAVKTLSDEFSERKRQLAQIQALDDQVKRITQVLENKGVLNNTIIAFISDNGAATKIGGTVRGGNDGSNWPLRMFRGTLFEGGVRTLGFLWSPLLKRRGLISQQLFHVTDWLPTLYEAAGEDPVDLGNISGVSQWNSLLNGRNDGPRKELVNIIADNHYAMIHKDLMTGSLFKLIGGDVFNNSYTGWERTDGTTAAKQMKTPTPASVKCNFPEGVEQTVCQPWLADCLFDLAHDPCETNNIAALLSAAPMLQFLQSKIAAHRAMSIPPIFSEYDAKSNPVLWNGWWVPWLDPVPVRQSPPCKPFNPSSAI